MLVFILWVESADDPALALDNRQPNDNWKAARLLLASLFEASPPFRLIVLVPDQQNTS